MTRNRHAVRSWAIAALCFVAAGVLNASEAMDSPDASAIGTGTKRIPHFTMMPDYPKVARRDRIEGEVQVCFEITRKGRTRRIAVRKSTHRIFEKPAIRAVRASTYEPLSDDVAMSGIKSCRTFRFTLEPVVKEEAD